MMIKFKICVCGAKNAGKTSLIRRYATGKFDKSTLSTIGVDFETKKVLVDDTEILLNIWDFAGEKKFRLLLPSYVSGSSGALILYDITNTVSLSHLPDWSYIVREAAGNIPIMLVGSKLDLKNYRAVTREQGINAARRYNMASFVELSSKTGDNVEKTFEVMAEILLTESKKKKEKMVL